MTLAWDDNSHSGTSSIVLKIVWDIDIEYHDAIHNFINSHSQVMINI